MSEFPALDRLEKLAAEMSQRARSIEEMTDQLNDIEVTVEEAQGAVQVTAGAGGHVSSIELDPRAMRMSSDDLAEALTRACKRAVQEYEDRVAEAMAPLMGQSGEVSDLLRKTVAERREASAAEPVPPAPTQATKPVWGQEQDSGWGRPATPPSGPSQPAPPAKPLWGDDDDQWGRQS